MIKINLNNKDNVIRAQNMKAGHTGILVECEHCSNMYLGSLFLRSKSKLVNLHAPLLEWEDQYIPESWKMKLIDIEIKEIK